MDLTLEIKKIIFSLRTAAQQHITKYTGNITRGHRGGKNATDGHDGLRGSEDTMEAVRWCKLKNVLKVPDDAEGKV